ncbi:MAG: thioredoxin [Patescibacteria group bacterium]|nr:thioredoxin [Patescibacteria group bacterium]MDD4303862.1 thioredoxin [Patescibacteria group bacterium]MDD4695151.1 thioredoxin [Patescibacteria group bacterium]
MAEILNDTNFDEFVKNNNNLVVDCFADWCGPCKALAPIIDELAKEFEGKGVKIVKLDVDQASATAEKFDIMSIPTVLYFKNGELKDTTMGLLPKDVLKNKIEELIK